MIGQRVRVFNVKQAGADAVRNDISQLRLSNQGVTLCSGRKQDVDPRKPRGKRGEHLGMAETCEGVDFHRDHVGWYPAAVAGGKADHLGPVGVMDQQPRICAASLPEGAGKRVDPPENLIDRRRIIADGTRGTNGGAGTAARTDHRINADMIPCRGDRPGWTDVQAI